MENYTFLSFPILSSFILFVAMVVSLWRRSITTRSTRENLPPGPRNLPVIGSMHLLFGSSLPYQRLSELAKRYGDVMHLQLGEVTNIIISSPEAAKQVMKTHDIVLSQRPFLLSASILFYDRSDIAFAPYGDYWRQMKKICILELLSMKRVESFRSIVDDEISKFIGRIKDSAGTPINLSSTFQSLNYSIISRAAFGKIWNGQDVFIPLIKNVSEALAGFSLPDLYPSMKWLHQITSVKRNAERIHHKLDQILEDIINEHKRKNSVAKTGSRNEEDDLVDVLLNLQIQGDLQFPLSNNNIKAVILDIFLAGTDTSVTTLEWAMSELLRNPKLLKKAQDEVRRVFGETGKVKGSKLDDLYHLKSMIKETLRLHSPVPLLVPRECSEKCEINGYEIPPKSKIIVNAWAIGRDPNYWVEADKFIPERFLDSSIDYRGNNFEFIPFGAGRRICPGILFSMKVVENALSQILYHFDWKLPDEMEPERLDMSERFGIVVKRKFDLILIPNLTPVPSLNLPPGPRKLPVIGNLHQLVGSLPHRRLRDLAKKHGSVMQLRLGEVSIVVISSAEAAKEVMKTHDLISASRPPLVAAGLITCNYSEIAFAPYGT